MTRNQKPHVSAALAQLKPGVTFACLILAASVFVQLLVFGFVHFTELRFEGARVESAPAGSLSVVPSVAIEPRREPATNPQASAAKPEAAPVATAAPRALSTINTVLHRISDLAVTAGTGSTAVLWILVFLGVVVGSSAQVPGVEKAVSAACWSLLLALACLPWQQVVPTTPFPGVFTAYATMTGASDAVDAGAASMGVLLAIHLVLPLAAFFVALLVLARFRSGIAAGVIIRSVSELDAAIEREAEEIARRGVSLSGPRTVGALNSAIGSVQMMSGPAPAPRRDQEEENYTPYSAGTASSRSSEPPARPAPARDRRVPEPAEPYRRPI